MIGRALTRVLTRAVLLAALFAPFATAVAEPASGALAQVNSALQFGDADKALALLASLPQGGAQMAEAQILRCRVEFALGRWDAAVQACQQAVQLDSQDSDNHMWLGRALGEKANAAMFVTAFSLGKRVLVEFQTAATLNPRNGPALWDLGDFYVEAPSVIGGGIDKARDVAEQLDRVDAARAAGLRGRIAQEQKDYVAAEQAYKQAIAVSAHPAHEWATLALFYRERSRWADMDAAIESCQAAVERDERARVALYDAAGVLIDAKREPALAAKLLEEYLSGPGRSDEAPAFVAYVRLARLKQKLGDSEAAKQEQAEALALAHDYSPAQDFRR